jgi:hypothetical protein
MKPAPSRDSRIHPGEIAILIATRARPQYLAEVLQSLARHTLRKDKTALWIYVDDNDEVTQSACAEHKFCDPGFPVHWHVGPPPASLGETHEALWAASGRTAEIYMVSVDDARFDTPAWDDVIRRHFASYHDGVLLAFPHDPMTHDVGTYPIFGWRWLETMKQVFPGYFPYWFDDHWMSQIALLIGRWFKLPILLYPIRGKGRTKRMRNLPFWTRFFQLMLVERRAAASRLLDAIHPDDSPQRVVALAVLEKIAVEFAAEAKGFSDLYTVFQEERHTEMSPAERRAFDEAYFRQEALAVARLITHAHQYIEKKQFAEALTVLDATQLSDLRSKHAQILKAECLRALGRTGEARWMEEVTVAAWPEFNGYRRLFRFLGMVANDGKRLFVGLTEKGKK